MSFAKPLPPRRAVYLSALALTIAQQISAATAIRPIERTDTNSRIAHEQLLQKAKQGRTDIYFEGDSITRRWGCTDPQWAELLANWKKNFFGWNAADFAWGGDTVQNILWRLENGELDGVDPKVIVLLAGTNNLGGNPPADEEGKINEVVAGIQAILKVMREKAPNATIIITGITPRRDRQGGTGMMSVINQINARLAKLTDGKSSRYININDRLADADGKLVDGVTVDGLHLSAKGCQIWADALKPIFNEVLGPPAKEDHAPPPTGDPSAMRRK